MSVQGTLSAAERSIRSVFVGNIPYEATEEQLKDIFSEVGPVISFRLVYDRETGKPKGYGFCEYKDQETALSAMRNLNGYELNGRALRVDNAASEKNREELKNLQAALGGPPQESPYGPEVESDKAPEAISKAVASLPPEQMFELMKQMKLCIQNNPNEARNMLLQNPQLAYALLQAQVVMRIVDPQVAMNMLHRSNVNTGLTEPLKAPAPPVVMNTVPMAGIPSVNMGEPAFTNAGNAGGIRPALLGERPPLSELNRPAQQTPPAVPSQFGDSHGAPRDFDLRDPRGMDPRNIVQRPVDPRNLDSHTMDPRTMGDRDMRTLPPPSAGPRDPREMREAPRDPRMQSGMDQERPPPFDPRFRGEMHNNDNRPGMYDGRNFDQRNSSGPSSYDQRSPMYEQRDPRLQSTPHSNMPPSGPNQSGIRMPVRPQMSGPPRPTGPPLQGPPPPIATPQRTPVPASGSPAQSQISAQDQEKAALIMQVLQLSEQQIAMLPPEQRQSIMVLKDQIARSTNQ